MARHGRQASAPGDFIALKWSGLGREAQELPVDRGAGPATPRDARRRARGLRPGRRPRRRPAAGRRARGHKRRHRPLDPRTLQRVYNAAPPPRARRLMYTTYQGLPTLDPGAPRAADLAAAADGGFTLGVWKARARRLPSPRSPRRRRPAEQAGHRRRLRRARGRGADAALERRPAGALRRGALPARRRHARDAQRRQRRRRATAARRPGAGGREGHGAPGRTAQLQGMADEISCELVAASRRGGKGEDVDRPRPFKCATWGTVGECLNFLYRRALENQDAAGRTGGDEAGHGAGSWRGGGRPCLGFRSMAQG